MDFNCNNIKFSKYVRTVKNEKDIIIINGDSGVWGIIDKNMYDKIIHCIESKSSPLAFIRKLENEYDKKQLSEIFQVLIDEKMLTSEEEKFDINIKDVEFKMTNKCNFNCIHCGEASSIYSKEVLTTKDIKIILNKIFKLNIEELFLTGGEPLIREDIREILSYIGENFKGEVKLLTNGSFIDKEMAEVLKKYVSAVSVSIDGYDEKSIEFVRGKGNYKKIIDGICRLKEVGFTRDNIILTMTAIKQNINHEKEFYELCEELNVIGSVRLFSAAGRGLNNYKTIGVINGGLLSKNLNDELEEIREELKCKIFCRAGITKIMVDEKGDIYPCLALEYDEYKFGNLIKDDLFEIFNSKKYQEFLDNNIVKTLVDAKSKCKDCNVRYFCMDSCPGVNHSIYDNVEVCAERCSQMKPYLNKVLWDK